MAVGTGRRTGGLGPPEVRQFPGGASNLTYLLRYPGRDLVLRRPPLGHKAASAHDMGREFRVQRQLKAWFPYVPEVLALCEDPSVIGSTFYVMARIEGLILRQSVRRVSTAAGGGPGSSGLRAIDCLVELHRDRPRPPGLADLGRGAGYVGRQVSGWIRALPQGADPERARATSGHGVAGRRNQPDIRDLPDPQRLPARQPGTVDSGSAGSSAYWTGRWPRWATRSWISAGRWRIGWRPTTTRCSGGSSGSRATLRACRPGPSWLQYYCSQTGLVVDDWVFYEVFGLFRLAVIMQQIYYRFYHGQTTNAAYQDLWLFVDYLKTRCRRLAAIGG